MTEKTQKSEGTPLVPGLGYMETEAEESRVKDYVKRVKWRLNREVSDHPFSYTVVTQNSELEAEFWWLADMIEKYGITEGGGGARQKFLYYRRQWYWRVYMHQAGDMIRRTGQDAQGPS